MPARTAVQLCRAENPPAFTAPRPTIESLMSDHEIRGTAGSAIIARSIQIGLVQNSGPPPSMAHIADHDFFQWSAIALEKEFRASRQRKGARIRLDQERVDFEFGRAGAVCVKQAHRYRQTGQAKGPQ